MIFNQTICNFTMPQTIISDNGPEFNNQIPDELGKSFSVKKVNVQAHKPQSNAIVEELNRKIITCLRSSINPYSIT